jgi:hypothetical protein
VVLGEHPRNFQISDVCVATPPSQGGEIVGDARRNNARLDPALCRVRRSGLLSGAPSALLKPHFSRVQDRPPTTACRPVT